MIETNCIATLKADNLNLLKLLSTMRQQENWIEFRVSSDPSKTFTITNDAVCQIMGQLIYGLSEAVKENVIRLNGVNTSEIDALLNSGILSLDEVRSMFGLDNKQED